MNQTEKESYEILKKQGYLVEKPVKTKWQRTDFFGVWDFIAVKNDHIRFIQVSKKYFTEKPKEDQDLMLNFPCPPNATREYWFFCKRLKRLRIVLIDEVFKHHVLEVRALRKQCPKKKKS